MDKKFLDALFGLMDDLDQITEDVVNDPELSTEDKEEFINNIKPFNDDLHRSVRMVTIVKKKEES